jgi:hypothetical protein
VLVAAERRDLAWLGLPLGGRDAYQACVSPQWGQPTEVETGASNTKPQPQE